MKNPRTTSDNSIRRHRVILGATCYADAEAALHLAIELAKRTGAELQGLLVSDDTALSAATRPNARAVSFSGATMTRVTVDTMRTAYRGDARLFETQLLRRAAAASVRHGFRAMEGRLSRVLMETADAGDVIIFGYHRAVRDGDSIVIVLDPEVGGVDGDEALRLAAGLSEALHKRLIVFPGNDGQREIAATMAGRGVFSPEIRPFGDAQSLLRHLEGMSPSAVIFATQNPDPALMTRIVDAARSPVIVPVSDAREAAPRP